MQFHIHSSCCPATIVYLFRLAIDRLYKEDSLLARPTLSKPKLLRFDWRGGGPTDSFIEHMPYVQQSSATALIAIEERPRSGVSHPLTVPHFTGNLLLKRILTTLVHRAHNFRTKVDR